MRTLVLISFVSILSGCPSPWVHNPPRTVQSGSDAWTRSIDAVTDAGYTVVSSDREAGMIVTDWETSTSAGSDVETRIRMRVRGSSVRVEMQCRQTVAGKHADCGGKVPKPLADKTRSITAAVSR